MEVFEAEIQVSASDLDELQHVNNVQYLYWVQQVASEHWNSKASESLREEYVWMVLSHHIAYKKQAFLGDHLILRTYVTRSEGVTSTRVVEILRKSDRQLLAESSTEWCLLKRQSLKPARITAEIAELFNT